VCWLRNLASRTVLPGFEGLDLLFVTRFFARGLSNGALALRASAISFQVIMAFFPTIILLFSLIPYVSADYQYMLVEYLSQVIPEQIYGMFEGTIQDLVTNKRMGVLSITFVLMLYYASRSVSSILSAFNQSVNLLNKTGAIVQFFVSFLIMLGFTVLVITALFLTTIGEWVAEKLSNLDLLSDGIQRFFFFTLNYGIVLLLFMVAISILYNVGNKDDKGWRIVSAGTTFSSVLMILISLGFASYINNFTSFDELYGYLGSAIGAIIIFCLWLYFNSMVLLIGFELNASISRARAHHEEVSESFIEEGVQV
jgi:membrane protein